MTTIELEQVIRELICNIYKKKYIGKINIEKLNPGYYIKLGMSTPNLPIVIYALLEDSDFIKFLKQELKDRNFHLQDFGELNLIRQS